jgi:hypothetical protein
MKLFLALYLIGAGRPIPAQAQRANAPHSMKGYELYSWRSAGDWYFSLLIGTNRLKTRDEVTAQEIRLSGIEALKERLQKLPKGEDVIWSVGLVPGMSLPADEVIKEIRVYCDERGIKLQVNAPLDQSKKRATKGKGGRQ